MIVCFSSEDMYLFSAFLAILFFAAFMCGVIIGKFKK